MLKLLFSIYFLFCFSDFLCSQEPNYQIYNYTVNDGLPSNECHDILQDSLGYIWLATDRGLVKWDGYEFKVYGLQKGLKDMSCLNLYLDSNNNIWISTISSGLFRYEAELDTIIEYKHNEILLKLNGRISFLGEITVCENGDLIVKILEKGPFLITDNGKVEFLVSDNDKKYVNIRNYNGTNMISRYMDHESTVKAPDNVSINFNGTLTDPCVNLKDSRFAFHTRVYSFGKDSSIFVYRGVKYLYINGELQKCKASNTPMNDLIAKSNEEFYTCGIDLEGVHFYTSVEDFFNDQSVNLLPEVSASSLLLDRDKNLWVTSLTQGLFYMEESDVFKLNAHSITDLDIYNSDLITLENNRIVKNYSPSLESTIVNTYPAKRRTLTVNTDRGFAVLTGSKTTLVNIDKTMDAREHDVSFHSSYSTQILEGGNYIVWGRATVQKFGEDDAMLESLRFVNYPSIGRVTSVYTSSDDQIYIGTISGLHKVDNKQVQKVNYDKKGKESSRINGILEIENGMALATIGQGLVFYNDDSLFYSIDVGDGLISDNLESVSYLSRSQLVATSKSGFSILKLQDNGRYKVVKNYDVRTGLPSNEVTEVKMKGDTIIVGTLKGLAYILNEPRELPVVQPFIESVQVNDALISLSETIMLRHEENNVNISFKALDYRQHGLLQYRYKINDAMWVESSNTSVDYAALEPGQYDFHVQVQSIDGIWGEEASLSFEVLKPWWNTIWFNCLLIVSLFGFGYWLYDSRIKRIVQKAKMEENLRTLEMSALRAQMNPHFIFNCLNSIQSFIMTNDKERAMNYLSSFAKLVRQTLNASIDSSISLDEEISMLENYLSLEKLRHKNRFTYKIDVDQNFDLFSVYIPPLLIQPYVENAVIHGMFGIKEGGEILVKFYNDSSEFIFVTIHDNGSGISDENVKKTYKSVGMNITSQRLKLLNRQESTSLAVCDKYSNKGSIIELKIRKINKT